MIVLPSVKLGMMAIGIDKHDLADAFYGLIGGKL